jgi:hypothetical protein
MISMVRMISLDCIVGVSNELIDFFLYRCNKNKLVLKDLNKNGQFYSYSIVISYFPHHTTMPCSRKARLLFIGPVTPKLINVFRAKHGLNFICLYRENRIMIVLTALC